MKPIVSYIRVSSTQQGRSGLGLEAQRATNVRFAAAEGFDIIAELVEVETGKGADAIERRPQLAEALAKAQREACPVLVAKLDRLTRNVHFGSGLLLRNIAFRVAEMPHADNFMIHIMLCVAEKEREMIAQRTKEALAVAKARGTKLGNPRADQQGEVSAAFAETLRDIVTPLAELSSRRIAAELNRRGIRTARGNQWHSAQVLRLLDRLTAGGSVGQES
jgi:DNA invertase Pin-like site-specific DNA recombinase